MFEPEYGPEINQSSVTMSRLAILINEVNKDFSYLLETLATTFMIIVYLITHALQLVLRAMTFFPFKAMDIISGYDRNLVETILLGIAIGAAIVVGAILLTRALRTATPK
jgi:hypothetical protein